MAGKASIKGLVSNDYNSDNSSNYDPSSDEENDKLQPPQIDDDETPADWAEQGDYRSLTPQELRHHLSNKVSIFFKFWRTHPFKSFLYRYAGNTTTSSNNYLGKIIDRPQNN